jgi:hypothetical protein
VAESEGGSSAQAEHIAGLDTSVAYPARVYDYWLGGKDNPGGGRLGSRRRGTKGQRLAPASGNLAAS